jgi:hypothetical protein
MAARNTASMHATPTVSFGTLAKIMGPTTPAGQAALLRGHKYPTDGPKRSYQNARNQLIEHLVAQRPFDPTASLRPHEREAVLALLQNGVPIPTQVRCSRPSTSAPHWTFCGVNISVFPDVELTGPNGHGALKVYFGKDPLARGVGASMAALLHHYKSQVLGQQNVTARHCLVYEARTGSVRACGNSTRLLSNAQAACQLITVLWPTL